MSSDSAGAKTGVQALGDAEEFGPAVEQTAPGVFTLDFGSLARFVVSFEDRSVRLVAARPEADQDTIDHLLDDHIAPRIIAADGTLVLHGSSIVVGSHLVAFLGGTGSGKSTFAASMHGIGHRLLGDDAIVISDKGGVLHGEAVYPSLRLYRRSIEQVFDRSVETSPMAFYSDKLHVAAPEFGSPAPEQFPLGAVFFLSEGDAITLETTYPSDACFGLVENSFAFDPNDQTGAMHRMAKAARVVSAVPCYELTYPHDFGQLGEVRAQALAALAHLSPPA
ncbi:hypothetical protein [Erythrobacter oryzae]|uniref:hypothetical protein n=1 Tax=Erythrobacter oryzae TaxID=3019556 RepID=UPI0025534858|nr:hypothetical protein [Erythrobacter sp. COR-2]